MTTESNTKVDIVVWSGGIDSTLVLDRLSSSQKSVWAFSINWHLVNNLQIKQQEEARKKYLSYARKKGYNIEYREITVQADMGAESLGLPQILAWFSFLMPYLPANSTLYFGYHRGDDFWEYALSAKYLTDWSTHIGQRKVTLKYPLQDMSKYEILEEIRKRKIPTFCMWTCEKPVKRKDKIVSCGKCDPCINLKIASYESNLRK